MSLPVFPPHTPARRQPPQQYQPQYQQQHQYQHRQGLPAGHSSETGPGQSQGQYQSQSSGRQPVEALYRVRHVTRYAYSQNVTLSHHAAHLLPRACSRQTCLAQSLHIDPQPVNLSVRPDFFGNPLTLFTVAENHHWLTVVAESRIAVHPAPLPRAEDTLPWEQVAALLASPQPGNDPGLEEALQTLYPSQLVPRLTDPDEYNALASLACSCFPPGTPLLAGAQALTGLIYRTFTYDPSATDITTPLGQVLRERRGVCQDFAHLQIAALRLLGLSARYVSGYILTGNTETGGPLTGADASHAWLAVWCPPFGWIELDPTNNKYAGHEYVVTAWGRDFEDVSPLKGVMVGGGQHSVEVGVSVTPEPLPEAFSPAAYPASGPPSPGPAGSLTTRMAEGQAGGQMGGPGMAQYPGEQQKQ